MFNYEDYEKSAEYIKGKIKGKNPKIAIVLGSGLGGLAKEIKNETVIKYKDIESKEDRRYFADYFERELLPLISPQVISKRQPFPFINNREKEGKRDEKQKYVYTGRVKPAGSNAEGQR